MSAADSPALGSADHHTAGRGALNDKCPHHGGLCAYDALSPARCPFCHSLWSQMLRPSDRHSCEQAGVWPRSERRWRVLRAREMRRQATTQMDEAPTGKPMGTDTTRGPVAAESTRERPTWAVSA